MKVHAQPLANNLPKTASEDTAPEDTSLEGTGPVTKKTWRADWRMTLFVVVMLPIVLLLGAWQLERAAYKQGLMDAYFDKLGGLPVELASKNSLPEPFTRVRVRGNYLPIQLLLDNQIDNSKPGYWVYAPFTAGSSTWLVNRGWIAAPRLRSDLPVVPDLPAGDVALVALAWPDTGMLPLFGEDALHRESANTVRMQRLDIPALEALLNVQLTGKELRLEAGQPGVLKAAPQTIGFGVERHQGYAFQWFGLALALITLYYFYGRTTDGRTDDKQEPLT